MVHLNKAFEYLDSLESVFLCNAVSWMRDMKDPTDVLLDLSQNLGQNLGPWETFRFCSLLKLTPAEPVKELGKDVLAEPFQETPAVPPVSRAFAMAHAHWLDPGVGCGAANAVLASLDAAGESGVPLYLLDAARLALLGPAGLCANETLFGQTLGRHVDALEAAPEPLAYAPLFEACLVGGLAPAHPTHRLLRERLAESQNADGSFPAAANQRLLRGLVTLKAIALLRH